MFRGFTGLPFVRVIRSIQRATLTLSGVASNTATITSVNTAKTFLVLLGVSTADAPTPDVSYGKIVLTNATTITGTRGNATQTIIFSFEVVEFW